MVAESGRSTLRSGLGSLRSTRCSEIAAENKQPRKEIAKDKDHQAPAPMVGSGFLGCRDNVRRTV